MSGHPVTREEWQALFDAYFPEGSGVLVTSLDLPGEPQSVAWRVHIEDFDDGSPFVVLQDVHTDYPLHFHIEKVEVLAEGHVLAVEGTRPGPYPGTQTLRLSNRLTESQRAPIAAAAAGIES